jgi:hypothetical protein
VLTEKENKTAAAAVNSMAAPAAGLDEKQGGEEVLRRGVGGVHAGKGNDEKGPVRGCEGSHAAAGRGGGGVGSTGTRWAATTQAGGRARCRC